MAESRCIAVDHSFRGRPTTAERPAVVLGSPFCESRPIRPSAQDLVRAGPSLPALLAPRIPPRRSSHGLGGLPLRQSPFGDSAPELDAASPGHLASPEVQRLEDVLGRPNN